MAQRKYQALILVPEAPLRETVPQCHIEFDKSMLLIFPYNANVRL
jgi:hypothetical protein